MEHQSGFRKVIFYNFDTQTPEMFLQLNNLFIYNFNFSPDANKIALTCATSSNQGEPQNLYIYDLVTNNLTQKTYANLLFTKPKWFAF